MGKGANAPCLRELKVRVGFASLSPPKSFVRRGIMPEDRAGDSSHQAMTPQVKMIVSDWYTYEIGNQARIIKARD
jgi:hypothetical protein